MVQLKQPGFLMLTFQTFGRRALWALCLSLCPTGPEGSLVEDPAEILRGSPGFMRSTYTFCAFAYTYIHTILQGCSLTSTISVQKQGWHIRASRVDCPHYACAFQFDAHDVHASPEKYGILAHLEWIAPKMRVCVLSKLV